MAKREGYLGRVQILRFVAASAVLFAHLQHEVLTRLPQGTGFRPFTLIDGGFGVDLFFVISGFIMYHVSADAFGQPHAARTFLVRRYLRVAPLYYLATLLMLAATFAFGGSVSIPEPDLAHVFASFLFLPALNGLGEPVPVLKLGWTLNFEAYFYVMFAMALAFTRAVGLAVLVLGLTMVVLLAQVWTQSPVAIAFWGQSLVYEFLAGIGVAMLYRRGMRRSAGWAWFVILASVALLVALRIYEVLPLLPRGVYAGVPATLIVLAVVVAPFDEGHGPVRRFLVAGGEASYALYVIHPFGIRAGALAWERLGLPALPWLYVGVLMVVVIVAAFAVNALIERPLDRWLRTLSNRRRASAGEAAAG